MFCKKQLLQRVTSDFLQRATSATSNERILQRVTSDFLQRATSTTSNEWFFATSNFCNEQRADFATSNEWIYNEQRVTSEAQGITSNEWKVTPPFNTLKQVYFCLELKYV